MGYFDSVEKVLAEASNLTDDEKRYYSDMLQHDNKNPVESDEDHWKGLAKQMKVNKCSVCGQDHEKLDVKWEFNGHGFDLNGSFGYFLCPNASQTVFVFEEDKRDV